MGRNIKCPKYGSNKVQMTAGKNRRGFLMTLLFGFYYLPALCCRWLFGFFVLIYDCFAVIVKKIKSPSLGYVWKCKRWFRNPREYYCHYCGYNFKG